MRPLLMRVAAVCFCLTVANAATGQSLPPEGFSIPDNYTKEELLIPMRDGVKLYTAVYTPKDAGKDKPYPVILQRTCYSSRPYGPDAFPQSLGPNRYLLNEGFIFVYQDVRGRWMSEGEFTNMTPHRPHTPKTKETSESSDTWDTIEFLLKHLGKKTNGRFGQWGISYPGFYAAASIPHAHPALKAVSPQAPIADFFFDDFHHNGVFTLGYFWVYPLFGTPRNGPTTEAWYTFPKPPGHGAYEDLLALGPLKNGYRYHPRDYFFREVLEHPNYDEFWKERGLLQHLNDIDHEPAVLTVGGWFDAEDLFGPLNIYQTLEKGNPRMQNNLVMGPWSHGDWNRIREHQLVGDFYFGSGLSEHYAKEVIYPFFMSHLYGKDATQLPEAHLWDTGAQKWRDFAVWPPAEASPTHLFLGDVTGTKLGLRGELEIAPAVESVSTPGFFENPVSEFVSDPAAPVPYTEANQHVFTPRPYMAGDQRENSRRPDVLTFSTDTLTEAITLAGPLEVELYVSTTGQDADWVVKLIDIMPADTANPEPMPKHVQLANYQLLVRSEVMRSRYREGFDKAVPLQPGEVTKITFRLQDVLHTFRPGHRIAIQVQSTWFPLFDRNPQTWVENIYQADESAYKAQTHRVYHSQQYPSSVKVRVLPQPR